MYSRTFQVDARRVRLSADVSWDVNTLRSCTIVPVMVLTYQDGAFECHLIVQ